MIYHDDDDDDMDIQDNVMSIVPTYPPPNCVRHVIADDPLHNWPYSIRIMDTSHTSINSDPSAPSIEPS